MATQMTLEVAREILKQSYRHILADHYFGDAELWWTRECKDAECVAEGYKGSRDRIGVTLRAQGEYAETHFSGKDAEKLIHLGRCGSYERNDEEGDDRNYPL
jgi:hypothetical protein